MPREHEWDSRWWSPIINAEHLAMRERAGIVDLSAFAIFDVVGPGALDAVQEIVCRRPTSAIGPRVYTPVLDAKRRLPLRPHRHAAGARPLPRRHRRRARHGRHEVVRRPAADDGTAQVVDLTSAYTTIGLWGPRARDILGRDSPTTTSATTASRFGTCREIEVDIALRARLPDLLRRRAGLGAVRADRAGRPAVGPAARGRPPHGAVPVGIGVYGTTGRIEKGYRAFGFELDAERTIIEAGHAAAEGQGRRLRRPRRLPQAARRATPQTVLCTLTVDDHTSASGSKRYMLGGEPILHPRRRRAHRRPRPPPVRHDGRLGALARQARAAWPTCRPTRRWSATSSPCRYMEELYPVTVGSVDATPLFDPTQRADQGLRMTQRAGLHQAGAGRSRARCCSPRTRRASTPGSSGSPSSAARGAARSSWRSRSPTATAARRPC